MVENRGLQLLRDARRLVADSWCRGADARDAGGSEVPPWDETAASWSVLGAMVAALEEEATLSGEVPLGELGAALYALAELVETDSLVEWNDDPLQTQANVVAVLDRAADVYVPLEAVIELSMN
jgi:hypothetical protein